MTWRHITGLCAILAAFLACVMSGKCDDVEKIRGIKELAMVFGAGIIGDANGQTRARSSARSTGKHRSLEQPGET